MDSLNKQNCKKESKRVSEEHRIEDNGFIGWRGGRAWNRQTCHMVRCGLSRPSLLYGEQGS